MDSVRAQLRGLRGQIDINTASVMHSSFQGSVTSGTDYGFALKRYILETETVVGDAPSEYGGRRMDSTKSWLGRGISDSIDALVVPSRVPSSATSHTDYGFALKRYVHETQTIVDETETVVEEVASKHSGDELLPVGLAGMEAPTSIRGVEGTLEDPSPASMVEALLPVKAMLMPTELVHGNQNNKTDDPESYGVSWKPGEYILSIGLDLGWSQGYGPVPAVLQGLFSILDSESYTTRDPYLETFTLQSASITWVLEQFKNIRNRWFEEDVDESRSDSIQEGTQSKILREPDLSVVAHQMMLVFSSHNIKSSTPADTPTTSLKHQLFVEVILPASMLAIDSGKSENART